MDKELTDMTLEELWNLFPIAIKKYNPKYENWYSNEKDNIINIVGKENIRRINHIGSTAVNGLVAKPIIDILLEISDSCNIEELKNNLCNYQWICMSEQLSPLEISFNKGYTKNGFDKKVFHLHIREFGDCDELYFRDYIIDYKDVAMEYGNLKLSLKNKYEHNRDAYTDAKTDFVKKYTLLAKELYKNRYY